MRGCSHFHLRILSVVNKLSVSQLKEILHLGHHAHKQKHT